MKNKLNSKRLLLVLIDLFNIALVCVFSYMVITHYTFLKPKVDDLVVTVMLLPLCCVIGMTIFRTYNNIIRYLDITDFFFYILGISFGSVVYYAIISILKEDVSELYNLFCILISILTIISSRILYCYLYSSKYRVVRNTSGKKTLIIGGGEACRSIISEMKSNRGQFLPICVVDDNPDKISRSIEGVPIISSTAKIPELCEQEDIEVIFFTIPSCNEKDKKRILRLCSNTNCEIKIVPYIHELISSSDLISQAKNISTEELLNREAITFDNSEVRRFINDKVCVITGGGGSIGSELCRQIARYNPKHLIIIDIYENSTYELQQDLLREHKNDSLNLSVYIASVRDYDKMDTLFNKLRPDIVFHAAAHKHVPLMETSPEEAIKNNIFGTYNTASLANKYHVEKFVLISTDKAVNPTNAMGASKRCCEMVIQHLAQTTNHTEFCTVRFGNVLGSNGSVIPLFKKQILEGGPVTITHPEIIRYFMTIPEAVSLVLQAGSMANGSEIFILDMGEPVKILRLAKNLIRLYGHEPNVDIKIEFTGLRPGEKLYEELLMSEEGLKKTAHNKIFIGNQIEINNEKFIEDLGRLQTASSLNDREKAFEILSQIVPTYKRDVKS